MRASILVLTLILAGNGGEAPKPKTDEDRIQGTWVIEECHVGSREVAKSAGFELVTFEADKMFITRNGMRGDGMNITLDPSKSPRRIDIKMDLTSEIIELKGNYELDGQRLQICYHRHTRPTKFDPEESEEEPFNVLYKLKRK